MSVFGETLKQARSSRGVTVKEAEQATRINRLHLAALEEENFSALPPLIYQRGIVRNYATYLNLNPVKLITMFDEARGGAAAPISVVPSVAPVDMPRQWVPNFAVLAFMVVMSAVVFTWLYSAYFAPGDPVPTSTPAAPSVTPLPSDDPSALEGWSMVPTMEPRPTEAASPTPTPEDGQAAEGAAAGSAVAGDASTDAVDAAEPTPRATGDDDEEGQSEPQPPSETGASSDTVEDSDASVEDDPEPVVEEVVEEPVFEEPAVEEPTAPVGDMTQLQFAPTADLTLTVVGDGIVLYDGFVAEGTVLGPFSAVSFEIYTSDANDTSIINVVTGVSFVYAYDDGPLQFYLP